MITKENFKQSTVDRLSVRDLYNGAVKTYAKCDALAKEGYRFVVGNNPGLDKTKKWSNCEIVRVAKTNSRYHGRCIQTLWAVRIKH